MTTYQRWPFLPASMLNPEQRQQWWRDCFVNTPEIERFVYAEASAILLGGPGSGKSTAVAALQNQLNDSALFIHYPPQRWPNGPRPWLPNGSHLDQILAAAATEIVQKLNNSSKLYAAICEDQYWRQFLFWLVEKHLGQRTLSRLQHRQSQLSMQTPSPVSASQSIYDSPDGNVTVWNQLDELVDLCRGMGCDQVVVWFDLSETEADVHFEDLRSLFNWLDFFEYPQFSIRAALPEKMMELFRQLNQLSGRVSLVHLQYSQDVIQELIDKHIEVATDGEWRRLHELVDERVINRASHDIQRLYNAPALGGWLQWADTLLDNVYQNPSLTEPDDLTYKFFARHIPLKLERSRQGVWRGPQFIPLDQQPYEFLKKLFALRGQPEPTALLDFSGSTANLNTLASRLRKQIEPLSARNIYLHNRRDVGYWLENFSL